MKLLWVNPTFLDYRIPLYDELNKRFDGNFHLVYSEDKIPKRCDDAVKCVLGPNAHGIKDKRIRFGKTGTSNTANKYLIVTFPSGIGKVVKEVNPDIIIVEGFFQYTPVTVWNARRKKIPMLLAYERTAHTERNCPKPRLAFRKFIGRFIDGFIANGSLTKEYLISQGYKADTIFTGGMCADSRGLALNCAAFSEGERNKLRSEIGIDDKGLTFVYVGQLIKRKGVRELLDAWPEHVKCHPNDNLLIIGDGPLREEFAEKAKDISGVKLLGAVDYSQIYKYYAISDVFVIPTLEDNWSLVVPEAMACGLPIACSVYNGCWPELVKHDLNGTTFDPLNYSDTVKALDYFHGRDLNVMGKASIDIESEFSPEKTAENVLNAVNVIYRKHNMYDL